MSIRNGMFSSESVSEGHPDKLADHISDAVLDEFLRRETTARVADALLDAGYRDGATGIDPDRCEIQARFNGQSADINQGVGRTHGVIAVAEPVSFLVDAEGVTPERNAENAFSACRRAIDITGLRT